MIKSLAIATLTLSLSGCALFDAYFMAGYDNQEYVLINKIRTQAQVAVKHCDNPQSIKSEVQQIVNTAIEFKNFTQYIPRNPEAYKMAGQMVELTEQIKFDEKTSPVFCKMKIQQVERNAEKIQQVLGSKPR
jgi:hypothetical protein